MRPPLQPTDETQRLEALRQYHLLDTLPEQALDDLTMLAAHICEAPISLISLVDEKRQWFKSKTGLSLTETTREVSFSGHVVTQSDLFIVPDAAQDERFADNPLVTGDPHIRFYAGAPLVTTEGHALGTLCVIDCVPRQLTPPQQQALRVLSRQVMAQLDLRRQTRQLVESEARLFQVFRNCPVGVAIHRWSDRTFVDVNAAFTTLFGWARDEVIGHTTQEMNIVEPDAAADVRSRLETRQVARDAELVVRTRGGDVRHVLMGTVLVEFRQEPHTITTFVDITERKQAELAASRLAAIVESSDDAIIGKDMDGIVTSWNRGAVKIFGYTPGEMVGTSIMRLIPADRQDEEDHILGTIRRGDSLEHFETLRQTKDGRLIDVSVTVSPIKDGAGTAIGASKVVRDITERKRAEGVLREREEQLRLYAEHSPAAIAMFDRDMKYLVVSRRWTEDHHLGDQSIVGRSHYEVFPEIPQRRIEAHRRCLAGAVEKCDEDPFPRPDGTTDWLHWEIRPWRQADGSIGGIIIFSEDITERKQAQAARRASEERYRTLFENAPDGIVIADRDSYYIDANPSMCRMLGYPRDEFIGLHASDIVAPVEIPHIESALRTIEARSDYHREWQFRRKDGSAFPADVIATTMPDGNLLGMVRDVTERKEAERKVQESEERFRTMANSIPQLAWITHADGFIYWYNQRWYDYTGTTPEQVEGWGWQSVPDPQVLPRVMAEWTGAIAAGEAFEMEFPLRGADGQFKRFLNRAVPIKDAAGQVVQWFGTNTDVDELKRVEQTLEQRVIERTAQLEAANAGLRDSRAELNSLFESLPGSYVVLTPSLKIVAVSDAYLKSTLTTREGLVGHDLFDMFPENPNDLEADAIVHTRASMDRVLRNAAPDVMAIQKHDVRRPDGVFEERYWSPINSPVFGADRQIKYIVHRVEDVTDFMRQKPQASGGTAELSVRVQQMEAEIFVNSQQLQTTNHLLEAANKELESFSYSVSHDLRAPLRAVNGFAGIVLEDFGQQLPEEGRKYLERIRNGGEQMGRLIDDLLAFSRLSRESMSRRRVDTAQLVRAVLDELHPQCDGRPIEITVGDLPPCYGDPALLKQVWVNLLSNAIKYSRGRTPAVVEIGCRRENGEDVYVVRDNGAGFDMTYAHKLFGVFQRLHRTDEFEGTGVGLAIVQRVVHRHGGRVWAEAEEDRGAAFYFTLAEEGRT